MTGYMPRDVLAPLPMFQNDAVVRALLELIPDRQHGQLCPVSTQRSRRNRDLLDCDCWQKPQAERQAAAVARLHADVLARFVESDAVQYALTVAAAGQRAEAEGRLRDAAEVAGTSYPTPPAPPTKPSTEGA